jgi:hypothetical protein
MAFASALVACGDPDVYTVVTVDSRPAVHGAATLRVTLSNAGTSRSDDLVLGAASFPVTFALTAPGRSGALDIQVDALDAGGLLVGRGSTRTEVDAPTADVLLDSADFVVNTEFADDQYPSNYFDTHGFQAGATRDGRWTVVYRDRCSPAPCNMYARQFEPDGRPATTQIAAGTNGFAITTVPTGSIAVPAVAGGAKNTVTMWNFRHAAAPTDGIACRAFDETGRPLSDQVVIASDTSTDLVSMAPMSNGNIAATWIGLSPTVIRSTIVRPDCTSVSGVTVSTASTTAGSRRPSVAATGNPPRLLYAWEVNGSVYIRAANATNDFQAQSDTMFVPRTTDEVVEFVRVAPLGTGFAVIVRWALANESTGPGRIEMYRTDVMGTPMGAPILVTTRSGSDFGSSQAFGVATRSDGVLMVVWHACEDNGDGQGCGVFARAFRPNGTPIGNEFVVPTTTIGDQMNPSVTALPDAFAVTWMDTSMQAPDVSGSSVRARVVYIDP